MGSFLQQIFDLLGTDTGSLTYHLILAFTVAGALQLTMNSQFVDASRQRRLFIGLCLLLGMQFILFAVSGLIWQGMIDGTVWFPVLDRAITLLSLIFIVWLWAYPDPTPAADTATLLLVLLVVAASVMAGLWWIEQEPGIPFNGTWPDVAAQVTALAIIAGGCLSLALRQPSMWVIGVFSLVIIAFGSALHWFMLPYGQDYPTAVRLAQIVAYPFLLVLPQRLVISEEDRLKRLSEQQISSAKDLAPEKKISLYTDAQVWQGLAKLALETDPDQVCRGIVSMLARTMKADQCLLVMPPDQSGKMIVQCGYEANQGRYLEQTTVDSRSLPMLTSSLRRGQIKRVSSYSTSPDLAGLSRLFNLDRIGNLLFVPVLSSSGSPVASVILFSPISGKDWTPDDQVFVSMLAKILVHFLQRSQEMAELMSEITQTRHIARLAQEQTQQVLDERQRLRDQLVVLQEQAGQDRSQFVDMAALVAAQQVAQNTIGQLQAENQKLNENVDRLSKDLKLARSQPLEELRLALEEIAILKTSLYEADRRMVALKMAQSGAPPSHKQVETIVSVAQDLRQPLSSIIGYTDFLLGESAGILGTKQIKYLERIKISTERMGKLLDDLILATATESNTAKLILDQVNLSRVINEAIEEADSKLRSKDISLQVDIPPDPLVIETDQYTLRKIVTQLLHNAGNVTPGGGNVSVVVRLESADGEKDYVLVQILDSGEGISAQDLPRVFSPRAIEKPIAGLSDNGVDFPAVKTMVEVLGGRTWVDSEPGQGSIFSVLLPVSSNAPETGLEGS